MDNGDAEKLRGLAEIKNLTPLADAFVVIRKKISGNKSHNSILIDQKNGLNFF
jgi:hypothetical protein